MNLLLVAVGATPSPSPTPAPTGGEGVKSGPIGLAVILVLCVASYFLFKSMSKHLRYVREKFPNDSEPTPPSRRASYRPQVHREFTPPTESDPPPPTPPDPGT
jgi:hypothetical protein